MKMLDELGTAPVSFAPAYHRTVEAACARITAPSVVAVQGTGLPIGMSMVAAPMAVELDLTPILGGTGAPLPGARGVAGATGADRVERDRVRIPAVANDQGIPPRRTPSRC